MIENRLNKISTDLKDTLEDYRIQEFYYPGCDSDWYNEVTDELEATLEHISKAMQLLGGDTDGKN